VRPADAAPLADAAEPPFMHQPIGIELADDRDAVSQGRECSATLSRKTNLTF
jgi:hypothetical protein